MRLTWTPEMIQVLHKHYPQHGYEHCAQLLGIGVTQVRTRVRKLRLRRNNYHSSPEQRQYIKDNFGSMSIAQLAKHLQWNESKVQGLVYSLGLCPADFERYTKEEKQFVRNHYRHMSYKDIGDCIGRTHHSVKHQCAVLKLKRTPAESRAIQLRSNAATRFQKGAKPHNHKPVGSTRIDNKDGYVSIKVAEPKEWQLLHRYIWEQANGPIPKGMNVQFIDGNRYNIQLNNLELVSKQANMERNTIHRYPDDLKHTIRMFNKLNKTINNQVV